MNLTLQFRKERKCKPRTFSSFALYGDNTALPLNNGLGEGKPQSNSLCIKRMFAAIKAFEDMMNIFRGYTVTIIRTKPPPAKAGGFGLAAEAA